MGAQGNCATPPDNGKDFGETLCVRKTKHTRYNQWFQGSATHAVMYEYNTRIFSLKNNGAAALRWKCDSSISLSVRVSSSPRHTIKSDVT